MAYGDYMHEKAERLVRRTGTRDPFRAAKELGINVLFRDDFTKLKGMYAVIKNRRFIFINSNLPRHKRVVVCGHELGHDSLHRDLAKKMAFQELMFYDMKQRTEYEANIFAAHFLLDSREILKLAKNGRDTNRIAAELDTDVNLLLMKMDQMNRLEGCNFNLMYSPYGDFLRKG